MTELHRAALAEVLGKQYRKLNRKRARWAAFWDESLTRTKPDASKASGQPTWGTRICEYHIARVEAEQKVLDELWTELVRKPLPTVEIQ